MQRRRPERARTIPQPASPASDLETALELAAHCDALDVHVAGQSALVRRVRLTGNERLEVLAARFRDAEAIGADVLRRQLLFLVGHLIERNVSHAPAVWPVRLALNDGHYCVGAFERELYGCLADGVSLLHIDLRGDMARRPLQIVRDRPVIFVSVRLANQIRDDWCHAAELGMT